MTDLEFKLATGDELPRIISTQDDIMQSIKYYRTKLTNLAHKTAIYMDGNPIYIYDDRWSEIYPQVNCIECALSSKAVGSTIINVDVQALGEIPSHTHDRHEIVYILDGEYTDTVTGKVYKVGETQIIPPNTSHGLFSENGCFLTVTWRPPYERKEVI